MEGEFALPAFYSYPPYFTCVKHRAAMKGFPGGEQRISMGSHARAAAACCSWHSLQLCQQLVCFSLAFTFQTCNHSTTHLRSPTCLQERYARGTQRACMPAYTLTHPDALYLAHRRLQPVKETRDKQAALWGDLILAYCRQRKVWGGGEAGQQGATLCDQRMVLRDHLHLAFRRQRKAWWGASLWA